MNITATVSIIIIDAHSLSVNISVPINHSLKIYVPKIPTSMIPRQRNIKNPQDIPISPIPIWRVSKKMGDIPIAGWFIRENPIYKWTIWNPHFRNPQCDVTICSTYVQEYVYNMFGILEI